MSWIMCALTAGKIKYEPLSPSSVVACRPTQCESLPSPCPCKRGNEAQLLTQRLMKLTRHRGHGGGREAVDVQRTHLVDLGGWEGHAGRQVATVTRSHEGRLLLHQLWKKKKRREVMRRKWATLKSDGWLMLASVEEKVERKKSEKCVNLCLGKEKRPSSQSSSCHKPQEIFQ